MTYPNPPAGYPQQYPGQVPQPQFQAPPGYPPQYAQPQQYQQPYQPQAAPPPANLARGSLEDYLDQPSMGGGTSVASYFKNRAQGTWLQFQVTRDLNNSDVRQQTDINGVPQTFKDGRPKFVLIIPVTVLQSSDQQHGASFTENGAGTLWVKGITSDALKQAMAAGGVASPDKALALGSIGGAVITMQSAGEKPSQKAGYSATKLYNFGYTATGREAQPSQNAVADPSVPPAAAPISAVPAAPVAPTPPAPGVQYQQPAAPIPAVNYPPAPPAPVAAAPVAPPSIPGIPPAPGLATPAPLPTAGVPVPGAAPVFDQATGQALDPEKAALLARLQGQG